MGNKILAFNWKMNPSSLKEAKDIASFVRKYSKNSKSKIIVIPPYLYIKDLISYFKNYNIKIGAQDVSAYPNTGAHTGDISSDMLKNIGVRYSVIGHSERRYILGEKDSLIKGKVLSAQNSGIIPILCVGEKSKMSFQRAKKFIVRQLFSDIQFSLKKKIIIAYEPVWAIGGNKKTKAEYSAKIIDYIKNMLKLRLGANVPVLYGGSISCKNIDNFIQYKVIDGFLIGSAGTKKDELRCLIEKF